METEVIKLKANQMLQAIPTCETCGQPLEHTLTRHQRSDGVEPNKLFLTVKPCKFCFARGYTMGYYLAQELFRKPNE